MKNSFIKKVAVLSAGAVVLSSMSFLGVNAQTAETAQQNTYLGGDCTVNHTIAAHDVDFQNFNTAAVAANHIINAGVKSGGVEETSLFAFESESTTSASTGTTMFVAVRDDCGTATWTVNLDFTDLTSGEGNKVFEDSIIGTWNGIVHVLGWLEQANTEIKAWSGSKGWSADEVYNPDYTNVDEWGGINNVLERTTANGNLYGATYGADLDFSLIIPQYQPAGTYQGDMTLTLTVD